MTSLWFMAVALAAFAVPSILVSQQPSPNAVAAPQSPAVPAWPLSYPPGDRVALGTRITILLSDPMVARAHWGIAVTAMDGTPIYGLDEGKLFRPASNAKLFTTAAAMALLGSQRRFKTRVLSQGTLVAGTLNGDLVLVGGGDPTFASGLGIPYSLSTSVPGVLNPGSMAAINDLANEIAAAGVKQVHGDVIGDDRYFEWDPYPAGWSTEDTLWGYGAPASALTFHDNQLLLSVATSGTDGGPTSASFDLNLPFYKINDTARTVQSSEAPAVSITRKPDSKELNISGTVPARIGVFHTSLAIVDPAAFAALALKDALQQLGILVTGGTRALHWEPDNSAPFNPRARIALAPPLVRNLLQPGIQANCEGQSAANAPPAQGPVVAARTSPPLFQDVVLTDKTSENQHAEVLLRDIAAAKDCEPTLLHALAWEREFLLTAGLDPNDFVFYDGSGLSTKDLVTPRAEVQLLAYAAQQPWFAQWKPALPVGGVDGTLESRFTQPPLKGHVFAKTGTLGESRALGGYVLCASGQEVIFSIMVDNHEPGTSADRTAMDKIVEAIAETN